MDVDPQHVRLIEALLFASPEPLDEETLRSRLPPQADLTMLLGLLGSHYEGRGVQLVRVAGKWTFRTAPDLADSMRLERPVKRRLSRAAIETLAVIAYHQPVTRAEIEQIRGVSLNKGTLDVLLESGWIQPGRRRETLGRPLTWVTTDGFLEHFSLGSLADLPGIEEIHALGLFEFESAGAPAGEGSDEAPGQVIEE